MNRRARVLYLVTLAVWLLTMFCLLGRASARELGPGWERPAVEPTELELDLREVREAIQGVTRALATLERSELE